MFLSLIKLFLESIFAFFEENVSHLTKMQLDLFPNVTLDAERDPSFSGFNIYYSSLTTISAVIFLLLFNNFTSINNQMTLRYWAKANVKRLKKIRMKLFRCLRLREFFLRIGFPQVMFYQKKIKVCQISLLFSFACYFLNYNL